VLIVPIVFAISSRFDMPAVVVAVPALAALSVAHGLLPALVLLGSTAIEIAAPQMAAAVPLLRFITHPDIVLLLARIV
jgi:H+/gluconate symporter-like permease